MDSSNYFQYALIVLCGFLSAFYVNRSIASYPYKAVHDMFTNNSISTHYGSNQDIIAIVTGSTSGLGEGIASELFKYGFTVIIASRNREKSMRVIDAIHCKYPGSAGRLIFNRLDTSDLQSVGQFSSWFRQTFDHLDYLVNNAGIHYASLENNPLFNTSAAMGAMFDPSLRGGEFVANQILILSCYSWFRSLLEFTTKHKLREPLVLLLAIVQVFTQSQSYGYHVH